MSALRHNKNKIGNAGLVNAKSGNCGFSLVELIIVIAIMAILVGVLAPIFIRYIERSRMSVDAEAVGSMLSALKAASVEPGEGEAPPRILRVVWQSGSGGGITVAAGSGVDSSNNLIPPTPDATRYEAIVHEVVGDTILPRSRAASAAGAYICVDLQTDVGLSVSYVVSTTVNDNFQEMLDGLG